ncbi:hypothetical protein DMZ48_02310 [Robertkochia solimangrovi]|nr:hypothetical protein DMZ48_02310 [Robertkochia solimangrovi]
MAWRDGRSGVSKIALFMASIVLGIAALVSIQSFGDNLNNNIALQSKALMGADYTIDSDNYPNEKVRHIIDSLNPQAEETSFSSMAAFSSTSSTKLVEVRGFSGQFPVYGKLETDPAAAAESYQEDNTALVDATLMLQFGLKPGDSIKLGRSKLRIAGSLISVPGSSTFFGAIAPPVIIPLKAAEESGLIQLGSRVNYEFYFKSGPDTDLEELDKKIDPVLDAEDADLDTHNSTSQRLGRRYENFGKFLNLVAFIALLLGCVGVASSIQLYIREKLPSIAMLKCIGASKEQSFMIYLIQVGFIGLCGGIIGSAIGVMLQYLFPYLLHDLIPVDLVISISPRAILTGILLGMLMAILFALHPLISTWQVSPLQVLRVSDENTKGAGRTGFYVIASIVITLLLICYWLLGSWKYALSFIAGVAVTFGILSGIGRIFIKLVKRFFPSQWSFEARQSLLNLFRPQNQTLILILAIGTGTFLISTLYFSGDLLLAEASIKNDSASPNIVLLDVQSNQSEAVVNTIEETGNPVLDNIPIITMRVAELHGKPADLIRKDTTSHINRWILNHEFRVTYRDHMIDTEVLEEGEFVPAVSSREMIPVTVSRNFAESAMVNVGDTVKFNVQGLMMNTRIAGIRKVDWSRMQPNFSIVFPVGVLENAPQFRVITSKSATPESAANLQKKLVSAYPNISILDLRQVVSVIEDLLDKISWIIKFMASFSIITGIIVLLGSIRSSKYQRIKESVLLRTIGARGKQILSIVALEYLYLGLLGALSGILLSLLASQLLAVYMFETTFTPSLFPFVVLLPTVTLLILLIGVTNSRSVITSPPLQILKK